MKITQEKMNSLLTEFTKAVGSKKYKRIPYPDWKKLKTAGTCVAELMVDDQTGIAYVVLNKSKSRDELIRFDSNDKSFGEFLLTKIMNEGEIKLMPPRDSEQTIKNYTLHALDDSLNVGYGLASNRIEVSDFQSVCDKASGQSLTDTFATKEELYTQLAKKADLMPTKEMQDIKKENKMKGFNFDFGPCSNNAVKMSLYGLAVKNASGTWVSYDPATQSIIDVDILNFDGAKYLYKIPTAIKDIAAGDVVVHAGKPMFVTGTSLKTLFVVDPISGEKKEILLTRSPFGFDFATKIVNCLGNFMNTTPTPDNPFGNMWMLMLANGDDNATNDLLPLMLMGGAANTNPMMLYFLLNNKGNSNDLLPLMMMMNGGNPFAAPAHSCDCAGNCGKAGTDA
jgi:hypothetical protein